MSYDGAVRHFLWVVLLPGCFSKPGFGGADDTTGGDGGGPDAPYPTRFGPWQARIPVPLGGIKNDSGPSLSRDGRELFFYSDRSVEFRLYRATRVGPGQLFGTPDPVAGAELQYDPTIMPDGLDLYWFNAAHVISKFHRQNTGGTWLPDPNVDIPATNPFAIGNHDLSMVAQTMPYADPNSDIVEFVRMSTSSPWLTSTLHTRVTHSENGDHTPCLSSDGLELFWEHEFTDGAVRIMYAKRDTATDAFASGTVLTIPGVSSNNYGDPELSADGTELYFTDQGAGGLRIFVTRRDPL